MFLSSKITIVRVTHIRGSLYGVAPGIVPGNHRLHIFWLSSMSHSLKRLNVFHIFFRLNVIHIFFRLNVSYIPLNRLLYQVREERGKLPIDRTGLVETSAELPDILRRNEEAKPSISFCLELSCYSPLQNPVPLHLAARESIQHL